MTTDLIPVDVSGDEPKLYIETLKRDQAFTWFSHSDAPCPPLVKVSTFETTHSYGAPALFKPSVAEVMDQLPEYILKSDCTHFSIEMANPQFTHGGGRHRAIVTVYRALPPEETAIITDQQADIASLIGTIGTITREVERANSLADMHRFDLEQAQARIVTLERAEREARQAWTASRHYKRLRQYRQRLSEAQSHLRKAITLVDQLAEQQAMPDDFYMRTLTDLKAYMEGK